MTPRTGRVVMCPQHRNPSRISRSVVGVPGAPRFALCVAIAGTNSKSEEWMHHAPHRRQKKNKQRAKMDRGSLPFEQNGPKEDIDDLRVVVRICPL